MNLNHVYNSLMNPEDQETPKKRAIVYVSGGVAHEGRVDPEIELIILDMDNAKEEFGGRDFNSIVCPKCGEGSHEVAWNAATAHDFNHPALGEDTIMPIHLVNLDSDPDMGYTCPVCFEVTEAQYLPGAGRGDDMESETALDGTERRIDT